MTQKQLDREIRSIEKQLTDIKIVMQHGDSVEFYTKYRERLHEQLVELLLLAEVEDEDQ